MSAGTVLLCAVVMLCWGAAPLFDKLALRHLSSNAVFIARFYMIFILMLAPMVLHFDEIRLAVFQSDRRVIGYLAGSVLFTMAGLYLYYQVLGAAEASKVVPFCAAYPLFTSLLAMMLLKEPVTPGKVAGTVLVVGGTYLLARP